MQIPIRIKLTRKCPRCGLRFPREQQACTHCAGLSDPEVRELREKYDREHAGNANLGRLFLYIAGLILVGLLILLLDGR